MTFRLVQSGWNEVLERALSTPRTQVRIVCPFIQKPAIDRIVRHAYLSSLRVITRLNLSDFVSGVNDLAALQQILSSGGQIRAVRNLHAKVYLFDTQVIVTSANLTEAALSRNHEFGFVATGRNILRQCADYFEGLWTRAAPNVSENTLRDIHNEVERLGRLRPQLPRGTSHGDHGIQIGLPNSLPTKKVPEQAFVKIFGTSEERSTPTTLILDQVRDSGSHWACTYPRNKRPRSVQDGALMFMGQLVSPRNILVYGRATAMAYRGQQDDATNADIRRRPWKENWPHYIRVSNAEFVSGSLANGVSINALMQALGSDSFKSTQRNAAWNRNHTDDHVARNVRPQRAYRQQAAVELSSEGAEWISRKLERAFRRFGKLPTSELASLDWPRTPVG